MNAPPRTSAVGNRSPWLAICTLAALTILVGLGTWQLQRRVAKHEILDRIAERRSEAPVPLAELRSRQEAGEDVRFLRVRLAGAFVQGTERHLYSLHAGAPGWHVIATFDAGDDGRVLVDRGFVPVDLKDPRTRGGEGAGRPLSFVGQARDPGSQGSFVPDNDVAANEWYWRDLDAMAGVGGADATFLVEALEPTGEGEWPQPQPLEASAIPDRHLEYALTWYGLALTLLGVYWAFARSRRKP